MFRSVQFAFSCVAALVVCVWIGAPSLCAGDDCPASVSFMLNSADAVDGHLDVTLDGAAGTEFDVDVRVSTSFEEGSLGGYVVTASHDPSQLEILSVGNDDLDLASRGIQVQFTWTEAVDNETGAGFITVWLAPHGFSTLPSSVDFSIATVRYSSVLVPPGSPAEGESSVDTTIEFRDGLRGSGQPVTNVVTHMGRSVTPCTSPFEITLVRPLLFTRGDANLDSRLDISDPVRILNARFLALDDAELRCSDAADSNDDGGVDVSDAVYLFNFLFRGGPQPAAPYPEAGLDETPDDLDCLP